MASPFRVLGVDLFVERGLHESPLRERKPGSRKADLVSFCGSSRSRCVDGECVVLELKIPPYERLE